MSKFETIGEKFVRNINKRTINGSNFGDYIGKPTPFGETNRQEELKMTQNILEEKIIKFVNAIKQSLDDENWYAALTLALTLPDICGRLEYPDKSSSKRFIHWFNNYLLDEYSRKNKLGTHVFLNGEDAYALRCAYLHQGEVNIEDQWIRKVLSEFVFVAPPKNFIVHRNQVNNVLQLQVDLFCLEICNAIEKWVEDVRGDQEIQKRVEKLMTIQQIGNNFFL